MNIPKLREKIFLDFTCEMIIFTCEVFQFYVKLHNNAKLPVSEVLNCKGSHKHIRFQIQMGYTRDSIASKSRIGTIRAHCIKHFKAGKLLLFGKANILVSLVELIQRAQKMDLCSMRKA